MAHQDLVLLIFIVTYVFIAIQNIPGLKIDRPSGVVIGSTMLLLTGVLTIRQAYSFIDWDVITFLLGMLIIIAFLEHAGFFEHAALRLIKISHSTVQLLLATILASALFSAFFVNDTICLLFTPIILKATRYLKVNPLPYLIAIATASNIGSALTITGNPQNMYIGIQSSISFVQFFIYMLPPVIFGIAVDFLVIWLIFRNEINHSKIGAVEIDAPELNRTLTHKALAALTVTVILFIAGVQFPFAALIGASIILIIAQVTPRQILGNLDWTILLFFAGLFVVMGAFEKAGYMTRIVNFALQYISHDDLPGLLGLSAFTAILSNIVSNVPAVILMRPLIERLGGGDRLWTLLAMSSTFAGNLTLVGSVANLIVAEKAHAEGYHLGFLSYIKVGLLLTVLTVLAGTLWLFMIG